MKKIKGNIIAVICSIIVGVLPVLILVFLDSKNIVLKSKDTVLFLIAINIIICAIILVVSLLIILLKVSINKRYKDPAYGFAYLDELAIYKRIGRKEKKGIARYKSYTEWADHIESGNKVKGDKNLKNYERYLNKLIRDNKTLYDILVSVAIPIEVAYFGLWFQVDDSFKGSSDGVKLFTVLISLLFMIIFLTIELHKAKQEIDFVTDVKEILFPSKVD